MNYLAHLFLAGPDAESMIGGLLGDFVRSREAERYPQAIRAAIRLHLRIDSFTDAHPIVGAAKARMKPPYRRYAGVLLDVFFDHFLARKWRRYSAAVSLEEFSQNAYTALWQSRAILPPRLQRILPAMIEEDWLTSYREIDAIDHTLKRLAGRLKRENPLPHSVSVLRRHYGELESDFGKFFPELIQFAERSRPLRPRVGLSELNVALDV